MSEGNKEKWVCPSCGFDGNDGNFCCECGFAKPVLTAPATQKEDESVSPAAPAADPAPAQKASSAPQATPAQSAPVYAYTAPVKAKEQEFGPEDKKKANILCIVSIGLVFLLPLVLSIIALLLNQIGIDEDFVGVVATIGSALSSLSLFAGVGLMIYVRIRYKKSVFGKVLMWLYIALAILTIIMVIIVVVACIDMVNKCNW